MEAAGIGIPDEKWGKVRCAFLIVQEGAALAVDDVTAHCSHHLARFELPKRIYFVHEVPHTAAGKIAKPELRASYERTSICERVNQTELRLTLETDTDVLRDKKPHWLINLR